MGRALEFASALPAKTKKTPKTSPWPQASRGPFVHHFLFRARRISVAAGGSSRRDPALSAQAEWGEVLIGPRKGLLPASYLPTTRMENESGIICPRPPRPPAG